MENPVGPTSRGPIATEASGTVACDRDDEIATDPLRRENSSRIDRVRWEAPRGRCNRSGGGRTGMLTRASAGENTRKLWRI
jgi:hypothetical protein